MGLTIAEKILSAHSGRKVRAGEICLANIDFCFSQDGTSAMVIQELRNLGDKFKLPPEKYALVIDHSAPAPVAGSSEIHKKMRDFARERGHIMYDIGEGVCHQIIPEHGHVRPGYLILGADSHTTTYGALNCASTGVGSTDLAAAVFTGQLWLKVPASLKIIYKGKLPAGVFSKDLTLYTIGQLGADGATYLSIEFTGPVISDMTVDSRMTVSNMAVEAGAKFGLMEADAKTFDWLKNNKPPRKRFNEKDFHPVTADADAVYQEVKEFDVSNLSPQVAKPHQVDTVSPVEEVVGTPIQQGFIGTCTNGRLEDLEIAAKILAGKKIHPDCRLIVAAASKKIFEQAMKDKIVKTIMDAGGVFVTPGCGCCVGTHNGVPAKGENVISTANRNFLGRMGNKEAFIYLGSPATVAASMLEGKIADSRKYPVN